MIVDKLVVDAVEEDAITASDAVAMSDVMGHTGIGAAGTAARVWHALRRRPRLRKIQLGGCGAGAPAMHARSMCGIDNLASSVSHIRHKLRQLTHRPPSIC